MVAAEALLRRGARATGPKGVEILAIERHHLEQGNSVEVQVPTFDAVYTEYYARIVRYLDRLLGHDEAEDTAQDVFSRISRTLSDFRGDSSLSTWIYRIATNAALDRIRSAAYRSSAASVPVHDEAGSEHIALPDGAESAEHQAIRTEMSDCVQALLKELPEIYRTAVVLSDVEGLKNAEIAEVLGVTLDTVKIRLHRGRARFKTILETQCRFYRDRSSTLLCDRKLPDGQS